MHRYQPRFHIILHNKNEALNNFKFSNQRIFIFEETSFMAVTAYQNHKVIKKIY